MSFLWFTLKINESRNANNVYFNRTLLFHRELKLLTDTKSAFSLISKFNKKKKNMNDCLKNKTIIFLQAFDHL